MDMLHAAKQLFPDSALVAVLQPPPQSKPYFRPTSEKTHDGHPIFVAPNGEKCSLRRLSDGRLHPVFIRKAARKAYDQEFLASQQRNKAEAGKRAARRIREEAHYVAWLKEGIPASYAEALQQRPSGMSEKTAKELIEANGSLPWKHGKGKKR